MAGERWAEIAGVGVKRRYFVSDRGRVASALLHRDSERKILNPGRYPNGYLYFTPGRSQKTILVHRAVLTAFSPVKDAAQLQANHKNGKRDDNRLCNLEWVTCADNHRHSYANLNRKPHAWTRGVRLTHVDGDMAFNSISEAARHLGVDPASVGSALRRNHRVKGYTVEAIS